MSWLDSIIAKGQSLVGCDPPYFVDQNWPLKKQPPNIVSTAPAGAPDMVPLYVEGNPMTIPCKGWYTRLYVHTSPTSGMDIGVDKWWNADTKTTLWTVTSLGSFDALKENFPEIYALLAPLPADAPIAGPEYGAPKEDLEKYIEEIGSKDPEVPPEAKPKLTQKLSRAGFQWWHGALIVAAMLFAGAAFSKKRKGKKGKKIGTGKRKHNIVWRGKRR